MSGNNICKIDEIHICPTCNQPTSIAYMDLTRINIHVNEGDKDNPSIVPKSIPALEIKFHHPEITNSAEPEFYCEAQESSGGYVVRIPLTDHKNIMNEEINIVSQEWF